MPPIELRVIHGTLLDADLAHLDGVPEMLKLPVLLPATANAAELLRVTEVQVWPCRPKVKNSAANATRKVITDFKPRNRDQVVPGWSTFPAKRR